MKRFIALAILLTACAALAFAANDRSVTFLLRKARIDAGSTVQVKFSEPLAPRAGEKFWITIVPVGKPDNEYGAWQYLAAGATMVTLPAVTAPGRYEVRLHSRYPAKAFNVIHRKTLRVGGGSDTADGGGDADISVTFELGAATIKAGEAPTVTFSAALAPRAGEKYWITVVETGKADTEWGLWQYLGAGETTATLKPVPNAGSYEVRLHARYPTVSSQVIHRSALTVE